MEYKSKLRTKKRIKRAFLELLYELEDINKLSVKAIIDRAEVSKSTFYTYYADIFALIEEYENEVFEVLNNSLNEYLAVSNNTEFSLYIKEVISLLRSNEEIYRLLFSSNDIADHFISKLKKLLIERIDKDGSLTALSIEKNRRRAEITLIINSIIYTCVDYYRGKINIDADELGDMIGGFLVRLAK